MKTMTKEQADKLWEAVVQRLIRIHGDRPIGARECEKCTQRPAPPQPK